MCCILQNMNEFEMTAISRDVPCSICGFSPCIVMTGKNPDVKKINNTYHVSNFTEEYYCESCYEKYIKKKI